MSSIDVGATYRGAGGRVRVLAVLGQRIEALDLSLGVRIMVDRGDFQATYKRLGPTAAVTR